MKQPICLQWEKFMSDYIYLTLSRHRPTDGGILVPWTRNTIFRAVKKF